MNQSPAVQAKQPGMEVSMDPKPIIEEASYVGSAKLKNKVALITGGDSGIGKAVAIAFAKEGADSVIVYLDEEADAQATKERIIALGRRCLLIRADISQESSCVKVIAQAIDYFKQLNILVNNAAEQHCQENFLGISQAQLLNTFSTNLFSMFYLTKAVLPYLQPDDTIINTTSVTAYRGSKHLVDYAASKGAIVSFTRSLALFLVDKHIRVNAVAPGPIWTPLIPATSRSTLRNCTQLCFSQQQRQ